MNKIHRVLWNESLNSFVAVIEIAKSCGGRSGGSVSSAASAVALALAGLAAGTGGMAQAAPPPNSTAPVPTQLPTGGQLSAGQATVKQSGAVMSISQGSQNAAINWQSFNVGAQAQVNISQPNASAALLNRVLDANPSQIFGQIKANGQVFLTNPSGVYFAPGASVDVGSFVATTHGISDADFMAGNLVFKRNGASGSIENDGRLNAALGGYIALLAPSVINNGIVIAQMGTAVLAAGESFTLQFNASKGLANVVVTPATMAALVQSGNAVQAPGGLIILSAQAADSLQGGVVNNAGSLSATTLSSKDGVIRLEASQALLQTGSVTAATLSATTKNLIDSGRWDASGAAQGGTISVQASGSIEQGVAGVMTVDGGGSTNANANANAGSIQLVAADSAYLSGSLSGNATAPGGLGGSIKVSAATLTLAGAQLQASGAAGGGQIRVGGGWHGLEAGIANASSTTVTASSVIEANATVNGDGGNVVVWSDQATAFGGVIHANAGPAGGNGGQVEVSGAQRLNFGGMVSTTAPAGQMGSLLLDPTNITISDLGPPTYSLTPLLYASPQARDGFGSSGVVVLKGGNIVVSSPGDNSIATSAGAVRLYRPDGTLVSTLTGSAAPDQVGVYGVTALSNGNYVVASPSWSGAKGAFTWGDGTSGVAGAVSSSNSLVGSVTGDYRSMVVTALSNGNYVVAASSWGGNKGAATWGNGASGVVGEVSASNSLVGSTAADYISNQGVIALSNGNYVVASSSWGGRKGAATWGNGTAGVVGEVSTTNSLVGGTANDYISSNGVTALSNGNYVVATSTWSDRKGAASWGDGTTGLVGVVSASNSLVGGTAGDNVGMKGVTALSSGNYVVASPYWGSNKGAATWGNGGAGVVGEVSIGNSLVGSATYDNVSSGGVTALSNGNYVVASSSWNGTRGAATWGNGLAGVVGAVSAGNSLVGSAVSDAVSAGGLTALSNGNYVVASPGWTGGNGAATWGNGETGLVVGPVSDVNSLVGKKVADAVSRLGVTALSNGNYVVLSRPANASSGDSGWATWGNGAAGTVGGVSGSNSLFGPGVGSGVVTALTNGNYVVSSPDWGVDPADMNGAVTWGNGKGGTIGSVDQYNSLVGSSTARFGKGPKDVTALSNGNYVVASAAWTGGGSIRGAVIWGNGLSGVKGQVSLANSLLGSTTGSTATDLGVTALSNGNYIVRSPDYSSSAGVGAVTLGDGTLGSIGLVSALNSLIGSSAGSSLGSGGITVLSGPMSGSAVISSPADAGGKGSVTIIGPFDITGPDSVMTSTALVNLLKAGNVTLTASNNIDVLSAVNSSTSLGSGALTLTSGAGGRIKLGANISTVGGQTYNGAVVLGANVALGSSNAPISFSSTVDSTANTSGSNFALSVNAGTGLTTFGGAVGQTAGLTSLSVNGSSSLGGNVNTAGTQTYGGAVTLTGNAALNTYNAAVTFSSTVDASTAGGGSLSVSAGTAVTAFGGNVGVSAALNNLDVSGAGGVQMYGSAINSTGGVSITGTVTSMASSSLLKFLGDGNYAYSYSGVYSGGATLSSASSNSIAPALGLGSASYSSAAYVWTAPLAGTASLLLVGGGGGGGGTNSQWNGGGGGGGGVKSNSAFALTAGAAYSVTVGPGGSASVSSSGGNGGGSSISTIGSAATYVLGGGGGGQAGAAGLAGGSGGGGGINSATAGGAGTAGQGFAGAGGFYYFGGYAGGGGGAGAAAANPTPNSNAGNGGAGVSSSISGSAAYYGAGGGGSNYGLGGLGKVYTATGAQVNTAGTPGLAGVAGAANTGGGGGGGYYYSYPFAPTISPGAGGSGLAVLAWSTPAQALSINGGTGSVLLAGATGMPSLAILSSSADSKISGTLAGSLGVSYTGGATGVLALSGSSTYTGGTNVLSGVLKASNSTNASITTGPFGNGAVTVGVDSTSTASLDLNGKKIFNAVTLNGAGVGGGVGTLTNSSNAEVIIAAGSAVTYGAGVTVGSNVGSITLNQTISGSSGFTKVGSDTVTLGGTNNTYTGATLVSAGTLRAGSATAFGSSAITVGSSASSLASLDVNGFNLANAITLNGFGPSANVASPLGSLTNTGQSATLSGAVNLASNARIGGGNSSLTLSGAVSGSGGLTKVGTSALAINGVNTFTGSLTVDGGFLTFAKSLGSGSYAGDISLSTSSASLNLTGYGNQTLSGTIGGVGVLYVDIQNVQSPVVSQNTLLLSGNNLNFKGTTSVLSGIVKLGSATGAGVGTILVGVSDISRASLDLNGYSPTLTVVLAGAGDGAAGTTLMGALTNSGAAATLSGALQLRGITTVGGAGDIVVTGRATLVKSEQDKGYILTMVGAGAQTYSNANNSISTIATAGGSPQGALTLVSGANLTVGGFNVTNAVTNLSDYLVGLNSTGSVSLTAPQLSINTIRTGAGNLSLTTDKLNQAMNLSGTGTLAIQPLAFTNIALNSTALLGQTLSIPAAAYADGGWTRIAIGGPSTSRLSVDNPTVFGSNAANVSLISSGVIFMTRGIAFNGSGTLTLDAGGAYTDYVASGDTFTLTNSLANWQVYSANSKGDVLNGALSGQEAIWGQTSATLLPAAVKAQYAGNRYIFAANYGIGGLALNSNGDWIPAKNGLPKIYGQDATANLALSGYLYGAADSAQSSSSNGGAFLDRPYEQAFSVWPVYASAGAAAAAHVGTYEVTHTGGVLNPGYVLIYPLLTSLKVNPAPLTVTDTVVSAKTYDGTTAATLTDGVLKGVMTDLGAGPTLVQRGTFASANAGVGIAVTAKNYLTGNGSDDYLLVQPSGLTGTINPAVLLPSISYSVANAASTYGTLATLGAATLTGLVGSDVVGGTVGAFTAAAVPVTLAINTPAGTYVEKVTGLTGAAAANYVLATTGNTNGVLTINPLPVQFTATQAYNSGTAVNKANLVATNLLSGDRLTLDGSAEMAGKGVLPGGQSIISMDQLSLGNSNYTVTGATGVVTVTPIPLTLTAVAGSKVYDGSTSSTATPVASGGYDSVTFAGQSFESKNVMGAGQSTLSVNPGYTVNDGNSGANYVVTTKTATGTIAPALLTVAAVTDSKVYDATKASTATPVVLGGLVGGDTLISASQAFNSANALGAGVSTLSVIGSSVIAGDNGGANYSLDLRRAKGTITARGVQTNVNYAVADATSTYGTLATLGAATLTGLVGGDVVSGVVGAFNANIESVTLAANTPVGTYAEKVIGLSGAAAANYVVLPSGNTDGVLTINPLAVTLAGSQPYTGYTKVFVSNLAVGNLVGNDQVRVGGSATLADKNVAAGGVGISSLTGLTLNNPNYTLVGASGVVTVTPVALSPVMLKVYDGSNVFDAAVTNLSLEGMVNSEPAPALVSGWTASVAGANANAYYAFTGSTPASTNPNYTVDSNNVVAYIVPKPVTVANTQVAGKTYDGTTAATLSGGSLVGVIAADRNQVALLTQAGSFNSSHAGTAVEVVAADSLGGTAAGNYRLIQPTGLAGTISPAVLTASLSNTDLSKTYDGTLNAPLGLTPTYAVTGLVSGDTVAVLQATNAAYNSANVNTASNLTLTGLGLVSVAGTLGSSASDYVLANSTVQAAAAITPAALTVRANNAARFLPQADAAGFAGASYTGFVNGEGVSVLDTTGLAVARSNANSNTAVGSYAATLQPSGIAAVNGNYNVSYLAGDFSILGAGLLLTMNSASTTYGSAPAFSVASAQYMNSNNVIATLASSAITVDGGMVSVNDGAGGLVLVPITFSSASLSSGGHQHVGAYQLTAGTLTGTQLENFSNSVTVQGNANVTPLTVTPSVAANSSSASKVYDGTVVMNGLAIGLTGALANDAVAARGQGYFASKNAGSGLSYGLNNLSLTGADAQDYVLGATAVNGTNGMITPAPLTLAAVSSSKVYDGNTRNSGTPTVSGLMNGDAITLAGQAFGSKNVLGKDSSTLSVNAGFAVADGNGGGNYQVTSNTATGTITPADLVVSGITAASRTYDGTMVAAVNTSGAVLTGLIAGDSVTVAATGLFADKNAAVGKTVALTSVSGGADLANYAVVDQASTTATITTAALVVSGITAASRTYDGTTAAAVNSSGAVLSGLIAGDSVTVAATGVFANKNAEVGKTVALTSVSGGTDLANYTVVDQATTTATITPATLVIAATSDSKVYDGTVVSTRAPTVSGLVEGDRVTTLAAQAFASANALGAGASTLNVNPGSVIADGNGGANYSAVTTAAIGTITPLVLNATLNYAVADATSTYGTLATLGAATLTGMVGNDMVNGVVGAFTANAVPVTLAANTPAGRYVEKVTGLSGAAASNYVVASSGNTDGVLTVNPLALVLTGSQVYNGGTAVGAAHLAATNVLAGDQLTLTGAATLAAKNVQAGGQPLSSLAGLALDNGNYTVTGGSGVVTVTPAALLVSGITAASRTYDGTTGAVVNTSGAVLSGLIAGDSVTVAATGLFADKNAAAGKSVTLTSVDGGADLGNYTVVNQASTTGSITPAALVVSGITASNKVYNGTTAAAVNTSGAVLTGLIAGDSVTVAATGLFADKNAAAGKSVTLTSVDGGADLGNYAVTNQASTTAGITPAALTLTATVNSKSVDGSTSASSVPTVSGLIAGDSVAGLTQAYADGSAGTGKTLNVNAGFSLSDGNGGSNYAVALVANTQGVIIPAAPPVVVIAPQVTTNVPPAPLVMTAPAPAVPVTTAGVTVSLSSPAAVQQQQQQQRSVEVAIPNDVATSGSGFVFTLPAQLMAAPVAGTTSSPSNSPTSSPVSVTTASGQELPSWLKFNPETNSFVAAAVPEGGLPLSLVITVGGVSTVVNIAAVGK